MHYSIQHSMYIRYHLLVLNGDYRCKVSFNLLTNKIVKRQFTFSYIYTELAGIVAADYMIVDNVCGGKGWRGRGRQ